MPKPTTTYDLSGVLGDASPPTAVTLRRFDPLDGADFGPWVRATTRKPARCAFDGCAIPVGAEAFRPLGNPSYRYERIAAAHVDEAAQPPTTIPTHRRTTMTRKMLTLAVAGLVAIGAAACQPIPSYGPPRPPAGAVHAHGIADAPIAVVYGFGNPRCRYTLTVAEDGAGVIQTITGGPANGTELVTVPRTGTYSAWITAAPARPGCSLTLRLIDSL